MFAQGPASRFHTEWEVARERRRQGERLRLISSDLGVALSTVHKWTRDITLTPEQIENNRSGPGRPWNRQEIARRAYTWKRVCRNRRLIHQRAGRSRTLEGDPLHLAGCMLYWAEGSKGKNQVHFANSELPMVRLFREFMAECFSVADDRFALSVNVYLNNGLTIEEIERHWLEGLNLPPGCARKHTLDNLPTSSSGRRKRKLPYGVCSLRVLKSTEIVQHIFGAVQEYGGFDEPAWLG